jgi:hypothetical protein
MKLCNMSVTIFQNVLHFTDYEKKDLEKIIW